MNSKGQAFSVFELMIAGVVAFAILIVLLMVIGNVNIIGSQDAKTVISNGIKSISPSGDLTTGAFEISRNSGLSSDDLAGKTNLDALSIFFASGIKNNSSIEVFETGAGFLYNGSTPLRAQARVICKQTGEKLDEYIESAIDTSKYDSSSWASGNDYCGEDNEPCCIVILLRPSN